MIKGPLSVGDVVCVRQNHFMSRLIRLGAALRDKPNDDNHVAVVHHRDGSGTLWGIEGRPGGAGWVDMSSYVNSRWSISNNDQPRTPDQRVKIAQQMVGLIGTGYDWTAIFADGVKDVTDFNPWARQGRQAIPVHLVCSALAAYAYDLAGIPRPAGAVRFVQPADWTTWIETESWS